MLWAEIICEEFHQVQQILQAQVKLMYSSDPAEQSGWRLQSIQHKGLISMHSVKKPWTKLSLIALISAVWQGSAVCGHLSILKT